LPDFPALGTCHAAALRLDCRPHPSPP
jgi:hypothetical protein